MKFSHRHLLLFTAALIAGFITLSILLLRESLLSRLNDRRDDELRTRVFALSRLVELRSPRLQPYMEQGLGSTPGGVYLQIFDPDGRLLSSSSNLTSQLPLSETVRKLAAERFEIIFADETASSGEPIRTATFARINNGSNNREIYFFAQAGLPHRPRLEHFENLTLQLAACGAAVWLTGFFVFWWIVNRGQNSIQQFSKRLDAIDPSISHAHLIPPDTTDKDLIGLANSINRFLEKLATAYATQQQFVAEASHELRTPLAILLGENDVTLRRERSAADYRETIQSNREEIARLAKIVNNLLTLARSDSGDLGMGSEEIDLHTVCGEVCDQLGALAESRRISLRLGAAPSLPVITKGDPLALQRAIFNLVENALAATPPEESVSVSVVTQGDFSVIRIEDTGYGIEPEHLPKIFNRFYRTDAARARGIDGAGLGLAIVRSIIDAHKGSVEVASTPGKGSVFTIKIPSSSKE